MKKSLMVLIIICCMSICMIINSEYSFNEEKNTSYIALYVDDNIANNVPSSSDGYILEKYECNDDTVITWNYDDWTLLLKNFKKGSKCNYYFKKGYQVKIENELENDDTSTDTIGVVEGKKVKDLEIPEKQGYTFEGWYDDQGNKLDGDTVISESTTIVARWSSNTYKLTINNGTTSSTVNLKYQDKYTLTVPSKDGQTFNGWSVSNTNTTVSNNVVTMGYEDATVTANFTTNNYTITYNANGGSNLSKPSDQVSYNGSISQLATVSRTGYTFQGWFDAATGGNQITTNTKFTSSKTIYAHWSANTYTVSFDRNGGTGRINIVSSDPNYKKMPNQTFTYDVSQKLSKNDYFYHDSSVEKEFIGWSDSATGSVKYSDEQSVSNLAQSGTKTLYAVWKMKTQRFEENNNNVSFDSSIDYFECEVNSTEYHRVSKTLDKNTSSWNIESIKKSDNEACIYEPYLDFCTTVSRYNLGDINISWSNYKITMSCSDCTCVGYNN